MGNAWVTGTEPPPVFALLGEIDAAEPDESI